MNKSAALQHQRAVEAYLANPNKCLQCDTAIPLIEGKPPRETRIKKFCNQSCSALYNNKALVQKRQESGKRSPRAKVRTCEKCGKSFYGSLRKRMICPDCVRPLRSIADLTKGESNHREIRANAAVSMNGRMKACQHCGYSKFVEICHIKPVRSFPKTVKVREINDPVNLIYLCPNCHWELDHGMLSLKRER